MDSWKRSRRPERQADVIEFSITPGSRANRKSCPAGGVWILRPSRAIPGNKPDERDELKRKSALSPGGQKGFFRSSRKRMNLMSDKLAPVLVSPVYLLNAIPGLIDGCDGYHWPDDAARVPFAPVLRLTFHVCSPEEELLCWNAGQQRAVTLRRVRCASPRVRVRFGFSVTSTTWNRFFILRRFRVVFGGVCLLAP